MKVQQKRLEAECERQVIAEQECLKQEKIIKAKNKS